MLTSKIVAVNSCPASPESLPIQRVTFGLGQPIAIHVTDSNFGPYRTDTGRTPFQPHSL